MQNQRLELGGVASESSEIRWRRLVLESEIAVREIFLKFEPALLREWSGSADFLSLNYLEDIQF